MDYKKETEKLEQYVTTMYNAPGSPRYPYHNWTHTNLVVQQAYEIARHYLFDDKGLFTLQAAAWFHDVGHLFGKTEGHEETGVAKMEAYMRQIGAGEEMIDKIRTCILATRFPSDPKTFIEQVICDADTYHFGTSLFRQTDILVKEELQMRSEKLPSNWAKASIELLTTHQFYTDYCQRLLNKGKEENIRWLQTLVNP